MFICLAIAPIHVILSPTLFRTLLPQLVSLRHHRAHKVVGLLAPRGGEADTAGELAAGVAVVLHRDLPRPRPDVRLCQFQIMLSCLVCWVLLFYSRSRIFPFTFLPDNTKIYAFCVFRQVNERTNKNSTVQLKCLFFGMNSKINLFNYMFQKCLLILAR